VRGSVPASGSAPESFLEMASLALRTPLAAARWGFGYATGDGAGSAPRPRPPEPAHRPPHPLAALRTVFGSDRLQRSGSHTGPSRSSRPGRRMANSTRSPRRSGAPSPTSWRQRLRPCVVAGSPGPPRRASVWYTDKGTRNGPAASLPPTRLTPAAARVRDSPRSAPPGRRPAAAARPRTRDAHASPRRSRGPGGVRRTCLRAYLLGSGGVVCPLRSHAEWGVRRRRRTRSISAGHGPWPFDGAARGHAACGARAGTWCGDGVRAAEGRRDEHRTAAWLVPVVSGVRPRPTQPRFRSRTPGMR
jgi:hypothetical protein